MEETKIKKLIDWNLHNDSRFSWAEFSKDFKDSMERYLIQGLKPGGFAEAMLAHDYERALYNADVHNRQVFWAVAMWIRDRAPSIAQGSYSAIEAWCQDLDGMRSEFRRQCEKERIWLTLVK